MAFNYGWSRAKPYICYFPPAWPGSPITLTLAKEHLRAGGCYDADSAAAYTAEDDTITQYLDAASILVEDQLGRALLQQNYTATFSCTDCENKFVIDRSPMQSITSIQALVSGAYVTVDPSTYVWRIVSRDNTNIKLLPGNSWPVADIDDAAFKIAFTIGYGAGNIPAPIVSAILLVMAGLYENRQDMNIGNAGRNPAVQALLRPYMAPSM